ncbi:hypothetical protein X740_06670 [Mesorhizobium sp. LNHC221B00]|nr:hypothetical protein X740_06670 [Mesorhizobium sp. LNHC221B00]
MTQFWSVNHNQTAHQQIVGQHLWSPKTEDNGARNEFHNNNEPWDDWLHGLESGTHPHRSDPMVFGDTETFWNQEG